MHKQIVSIGVLSGMTMMVALSALGADVQAYPGRTVRMIVPVAPGGSVDTVGRVIAQKMAAVMGQQVVVDNRPGASTNIGIELAARAPADGYTVLTVSITLVVNPSLFDKLAYNPVRDFAPVSLVGSAPFVLVAHPSVPARSVKELIALAKKQPGKLNYPSGGKGTNSHIGAELFKNLAGINIVHVPYRGGGPALISLLAGESDVGFVGVVAVVPHIKAGRLRALGISSTKRASALPDVPTIAEAGVPGYEFAAWYGVLVPAGTPAGIVNALNEHIVKAMRAPDLAERFASEGADVIASSPAEFAALIKTELPRWAKVVKEAEGLRGD